jgi:membrane-bound lytic murein transglycosylase D
MAWNIRLNILLCKNSMEYCAFITIELFALRSVRASFIRPLLGSLFLCILTTAGAQDLWRLDSLMRTWPVEKLALENKRTPKQRVFPAVVTEGLYAQLQKDAAGFPVFADTMVAKFADMLGEQRREELRTLLGMAVAYFPMLEDQLHDAGLPEQLKYLPMALSAMNTRAGSNTGEAGLWMLSYPIALRYGLQVDAVIDERYDVLKSTDAAIRYLKDLHAKYQDWPLTVMVFSCGPANITRAIARTGGAADYRSLYPHFTEGHREIMPAYMAMIHLTVNADKLGLSPAKVQPFESTDTLTTDQEFDLVQLARLLEIPFKQLRYINPAYTTGKVPKGHLLRVPKGMVEKLQHALLVQAEMKATVDVVVELPTDTVATPPAMEEIKRQEKEPTHTMYTVRSGDSLYLIAKRYPGISAQTLKDFNGISDKIKPGQKIKIPKQ